MRRVVGTVTKKHLTEIARRGVGPEEAVNQLLSEARARYPEATIIIQKRPDATGFDLVAL